MADTKRAELWYPRTDGAQRFIEVGLIDVRAADSIRISYDFDRDGWRIEQASRWKWPADDPVCDQDWQEVAFVEAWARDPSEREPNPCSEVYAGAERVANYFFQLESCAGSRA